MSDSELARLTFLWRHNSIPEGVNLEQNGPLSIDVYSAEHLVKLQEFFFEVYTTLLTTRDVYRFRQDND